MHTAQIMCHQGQNPETLTPARTGVNTTGAAGSGWDREWVGCNASLERSNASGAAWWRLSCGLLDASSRRTTASDAGLVDCPASMRGPRCAGRHETRISACSETRALLAAPELRLVGASNMCWDTVNRCEGVGCAF